MARLYLKMSGASAPVNRAARVARRARPASLSARVDCRFLARWLDSAAVASNGAEFFNNNFDRDDPESPELMTLFGSNNCDYGGEGDEIPSDSDASREGFTSVHR